MKALILAAAVLGTACSGALAQNQYNNDSAKRYAPGQRQNEPGQAKKYAPGQRQKEPGQAKRYAPGQQQKTPDTTTGRGGTYR
jgi:hypothetical protein